MNKKFYNNNKRVENTKLKKIKDDITEITGGVTVYDAEGQWHDKGKTYLDKNLAVETITEEDKIQELKTLAKDIKKDLRQEAIYFEVEAVNVNYI